MRYLVVTNPSNRTWKIPIFYDFLHIHGKAEPDTIHRVYHFLAARFHSGRPETGDEDNFFLLTRRPTLCFRLRRAAQNTMLHPIAERPSPSLSPPPSISWTTRKVN
jgi:hypothetical protein